MPGFQFPPALPDIDGEGGISITSLGFVSPDAARPQSPALRRQVSLLTADKDADYFLFDESDKPIRCVLSDNMWTKLAFRQMRTEAWAHSDNGCVEAIAQYLIKAMGGRPGLSRERILRQFDEEYGEGTTAKIEKWEKQKVAKGYGTETFLEVVGRNVEVGVAFKPQWKSRRGR